MRRTTRPPLTEAQRAMVAANLGLARSQARRWRGDPEAVLDAAVDGLIRAARGHDPARGHQFSTYAVPVITSAIQSAYKRSRCLKRTPTGAVLSIHHESGGAIEPAAPGPYDGPSFEEMIRPLRPRDREVLRMRYRDDMTRAEAGAVLGVTRSRVRRIEALALARVRPHHLPD